MLEIRPGKQNSSTSNVEIAALTLRKSGESGGGVIVVLSLCEAVETEEEARALDLSIPGAERLWRASSLSQRSSEAATAVGGAAEGAAAGAAANGLFGQIALRPPEASIRATLGSDEQVIEGPIEILAVRLKSTPKACVYEIKARITGLDAAAIALLSELFKRDGESVPVSFAFSEQVLPFNKKRSVGANIGEIVSGIHLGAEYAGIVTGTGIKGEDGVEVLSVSDCGAEILVPTASISGSFAVVPEEGDDLTPIVDAYVKSAKKARVKASWTYLVAALGRVYLAGDEIPDGAWRLTPAIVASAIEAARGAGNGANRPTAGAQA